MVNEGLLMDIGGEDGDDPGSGWREVKKKQRVRGSSSTRIHTGSSYIQGPIQALRKVGVDHLTGQSSKVFSDSSRSLELVQGDGSGAYRGKPREGEPSKLPVNGDIVSKCGTGVMAETCSDKGPRIKQGGDYNGKPQEVEPPKLLMTSSLLPEWGTGTTEDASLSDNSKYATGIKLSGDIKHVSVAQDGPVGDSNMSSKAYVANESSKDHEDSTKVMAIPEVAGQPLDGVLPSVGQEDSSLKEALGNVDKNLLRDTDLGIADGIGDIEKDIDDGTQTAPFQAGNISCSNKASESHLKSLNAEGDVGSLPHDSQNVSQNGALGISESSAISEPVVIDLLPQIDLPLDQSSDDIASGVSPMDQRELQDGSAVGADLGDSEAGVKERFRERLWCFLFENLNRAVDELYLLCELECDMEQMKEAVLVLEESASDFSELKTRVERFENTRRTTCQSPKDGTLANGKTDHRRPHALSWEVRRMTTSPHRAEILSSSLEAFKKIQQERASKHVRDDAKVELSRSTRHVSRVSSGPYVVPPTAKYSGRNLEKLGALGADQRISNKEKLNAEMTRPSKTYLLQNGRFPQQNLGATAVGKCKKDSIDPTCIIEKQVSKMDKASAESRVEKNLKTVDILKKNNSLVDKEKERGMRYVTPWKSMDAWKEKRNWEDILKSPLRSSSRVSHSPGISRKGMDRARVLHQKLSSPEKKKKNAMDMKREAEEKHARAMRIRRQLDNERVQRLQRTSEKLNRVNEWQAVRSLKLREGMHARQQRSESRHEAHLAQVARRAGDESSKVNEVRFITSMNEENKKLILRQKLNDSETRRAEKLQIIRTKQKEDIAREEAVVERRKLLEAEKLQRLAEIQRKKEEAQIKREEDRKASSAAREARVVEQLRRKEERVKAQQEEAELLAQRLAEKLRESEQRRKYYLEQIRERASMDFRDQSSPLVRRSLGKEGQGRSISTNNVEDYQTSCIARVGDAAVGLGSATQQHPLKRRIKKIRQRLMALKYDFSEPLTGAESTGIGYRTLVGSARVKIGRWVQDLQRLRQARKDGAASIGMIIGDMVKFLEGKDPELHVARQAGLLDFISSALPASHTSKPEACLVTVYLLRLLRVVLSVPTNQSYYLAQNLLPPIIPMLSASLENYIKIVASSNPGIVSPLPNKTSIENLESTAETLDGFLWTVTTIMGHVHSDERQLQMQDGLMELIVAYQVIHHLRDLFALYDRPQVEGSPFPSSILLSLYLLAVLTSRPGTSSSIDWESCTSKTESLSRFEEHPKLGPLGLGSFPLEANSGDYTSSSLLAAVENLPSHDPGQMLGEQKLLSINVSMSEIPVDMPPNEECNKESSGTSISLDMGEGSLQFCRNSTSDETEIIATKECLKTLIDHKDQNNSTGGNAEGNTDNEPAVRVSKESKKETNLKRPIVFLLSAIAETGLVSLPSLLTGVLLQANNRLSSEQASYILPLNFEEVATGVLKVLNNLAILDIALLQSMLSRSDLKMEFFHLMSFLLSHCSSKWNAANDQVGLLLLECLLLLGYFALFHPGNQAVLRWGKTPTILHKVCDLPFVFFSDPELTPILAGTLVAACYGSEQNKGVVQQELSTDMLLSLLKSCKQGLFTTQTDPSQPDGLMATDTCDATVMEARKPQGDWSIRSNRKSNRKGNLGSKVKQGKAKIQRDSRGTKTCDEWAIRHNLPASQASSTFMLHSRFPSSFLDKAEEFFSSGTANLDA